MICRAGVEPGVSEEHNASSQLYPAVPGRPSSSLCDFFLVRNFSVRKHRLSTGRVLSAESRGFLSGVLVVLNGFLSIFPIFTLGEIQPI